MTLPLVDEGISESVEIMQKKFFITLNILHINILITYSKYRSAYLHLATSY